MRHQKRNRKLGRTSAHRRALFRNMATALIQHERIRTTEAKAKELRPIVEKLITHAKKANSVGSGENPLPPAAVHRRRIVRRTIRDRETMQKLFDEIAPRYAERPGGYTRIIKLGSRLGDNAPEALIELIRD